MKRIIFVVCFYLLAIGAYSQVPSTLSFQGYLTNDAEEPITDAGLIVSFSLYDHPTTGSLVWGPEEHTVAVNKGIFNVILGTADPLDIDGTLSFDKTYYLEITIDPDGAADKLTRIRLTSSAYSLSGVNAQNISLNTLAIENGGTGADNTSEAQQNLDLEIGVDVQAYDSDLADLADGSLSGEKVGSGIDASNIVSGTLSGSLLDTVSASIITGNLTIATGGTGAGTAANARSNLGLEIGDDIQAFDPALNSIAGLTTVADQIVYTDGPDSYQTATLSGFARSLLDDGSEAAVKSTLNLTIGADVQAYDANLDIYAGIQPSTYIQTFLDVENVDEARTSLGVSFQNVQEYDEALEDISGLTTTDGNVIVADGTNWVAESGATARASLGLTIGSDVQAHSDNLTSYATVAPSTDILTLLDADNNGIARSSLGVAVGSDVQAYDQALDDISVLATDNGNIIIADGSSWTVESGSVALSSLGAQPSDPDLDDLADGTLSGDKIGSGIVADNITTGTFDGSLLDEVLTSKISGTLNVGKGGTGTTSISGVLFGNGTSAFSGLSSTGANQYLRRNSGNTAYEFGTLVVGSTEITNGAIINTDVNSSAAIDGTKIDPDFGSQDITTTGNLGVGGTASTSLEVIHGTNGVGNGNGLSITSSSDTWTFYTQVSANGNLRLYKNGSALGTFNATTGAYSGASDKRLKKNILDAGDLLDKVKQIKIRSYHYRTQDDTEHPVIGVIAQETEPIFPSLVEYSEEDDLYGVKYAYLAPIAIKAIQEQQRQIDSLTLQIQMLQKYLVIQKESETELRASLEEQEKKINLILNLLTEKDIIVEEQISTNKTK